MALKTYVCSNEECKHEEEVLLDSKGVPREEPKCEKCGELLEKQDGIIESTSFKTVGSGWFTSGGY